MTDKIPLSRLIEAVTEELHTAEERGSSQWIL
jgi:hypothetical protein